MDSIMPFCDITIVPVPTDNKAAYLQFSERISSIYCELGASRVVDFWQDDHASADADFHAENAMAKYGAGSLPNFRRITGAGAGETVVVSVMEWPTRDARDLGVKAAISDPRIQATVNESPVFDGSRMIAGSFTIELDLS